MDLTQNRNSMQTGFDRDGDVIMDDYRTTHPRPYNMTTMTSPKALDGHNDTDRRNIFNPFMGPSQLFRPRLQLPPLTTHRNVDNLDHRPPNHKEDNASPVSLFPSITNLSGEDALVSPDSGSQDQLPQGRQHTLRQDRLALPSNLPPIVSRAGGRHSELNNIHLTTDRRLPSIGSFFQPQHTTIWANNSAPHQHDRLHITMGSNSQSPLDLTVRLTNEAQTNTESPARTRPGMALDPVQRREANNSYIPSQREAATIDPPLSSDSDIRYRNQQLHDQLLRIRDAAASGSIAEVTGERVQTRRLAVPVSRKKKVSEVKKVVCAACMEEFSNDKIITAPCGCRYCHGCLNQVFKAGCTSAADFPPKCHGKAMRINVYGPVLDREVVNRYKEVEAEFSSKRPFYCASSKCSAFISEEDVVQSGDYGICGACNQCTCKTCRMLLSSHTFGNKGRACPPEPKELLALRELCEDEEWKQCPSCQTMVEKVDGCDHIECQCGAEFCYRCASYYTEHDECDCASDGLSEDDGRDEDDEDEVWPHHRRMLDAMGRPICTHFEADELVGELCHGCLRPPQIPGQIYSCLDCGIELCRECRNKITGKDGMNSDDAAEMSEAQR